MRFLILVLLSASAWSTVPPVGLAGSAKVVPKKIQEGTVDEVILQDQFTYVRMGQTWFALVDAQVKKGQKVQIEVQAELNNFHSKKLNRTFSKIVFGKLLKRVETH